MWTSPKKPGNTGKNALENSVENRGGLSTAREAEKSIHSHVEDVGKKSCITGGGLDLRTCSNRRGLTDWREIFSPDKAI